MGGMADPDRKSRNARERLLKRLGLWALRDQPSELIQQLQVLVACDEAAPAGERITPRSGQLRTDRRKLLGVLEAEQIDGLPKKGELPACDPRDQFAKRPSTDCAFRNPVRILGLDLASDSISRDISRAGKRLIADAGVSADGYVSVSGQRLTRQIVLEMLDQLADPDCLQVFRGLEDDEPLGEFLATTSPRWAGRVRQQDYYSSTSFAAVLAKPIRLAFRQAFDRAWDDDDSVEMLLVLRLLPHMPHCRLQDDAEATLTRHVNELQQLLEDVEAGDRDPEDRSLLCRIAAHVSVTCLNALPTSLDSYRSAFYGKVRLIALACHNDFDCTEAAVLVLEGTESLVLGDRESRQRSEELATLRTMAQKARLEMQFEPELSEIAEICGEIAGTEVSAVLANSYCVEELILGDYTPDQDMIVLDGLPDQLRCSAADSLGFACVALAGRVWSQNKEFADLDYSVASELFSLALLLPLSEDGRSAISENQSALRAAHGAILEQQIAAVTEHLTESLATLRSVLATGQATVNRSAVAAGIRQIVEFLPTARLIEAYRAGAQQPIESLLSIVSALVPYGGAPARECTGEWLGPLADDIPAAEEMLERWNTPDLQQRFDGWVHEYRGLLLSGALILLGVLVFRWGATPGKVSSRRAASRNHQTTQRPSPRPAPLALPATGVLRRDYSRRSLAPLKIETQGSTTHYYIRLVRAGHSTPTVELFIRGGETIDIKVPLGTYELKYAAGADWYGTKDHFGPDTSYATAGEVEFDRTATAYRGRRLSLYRRPGGNLHTQSISKGDF